MILILIMRIRLLVLIIVEELGSTQLTSQRVAHRESGLSHVHMYTGTIRVGRGDTDSPIPSVFHRCTRHPETIHVGRGGPDPPSP